MTDLLLQKVGELLQERNHVRRELALYRRAFDAMVKLSSAAERPQTAWEYQHTPDADQAVQSVLQFRGERQPQ